jgi:hypothetical protein
MVDFYPPPLKFISQVMPTDTRSGRFNPGRLHLVTTRDIFGYSTFVRNRFRITHPVVSRFIN